MAKKCGIFNLNKRKQRNFMTVLMKKEDNGF